MAVKIAGTEWDDDNLSHIEGEHGERDISRDDVDEVLFSTFAPARAIRIQTVSGETRCVVHGRTCDGRFLQVVTVPKPNDFHRPIHARDLEDDEAESYLGWRRTIKR
ncbi:MAG TPA: hypothetical protein VKB92_09300 [Myxococcales bacterium]|nr:hypothetical protein [Myxococcales bacterium]